MKHRSPSFVVLSLVVALGLLATGCGRSSDDEATPATTPATSAPAAIPPGLSAVAQAKGEAIKVFGSAGDTTTPTHTLKNPIPSGAPLVFLVEKVEGEWLQVLLPVRPNGATGWIKASDVNLSTHNFRIVVELSAYRITVRQGDQVLLSEPVALGKGNTPTPGGKFFIRELLQPPNPNTVYGPYAYGLSGFSETLTTFAGGEAIIGIHGNNDPSTLGKDVSAGCIRMSNSGITMLAKTLPLGTPVEILG